MPTGWQTQGGTRLWRWCRFLPIQFRLITQAQFICKYYPHLAPRLVAPRSFVGRLIHTHFVATALNPTPASDHGPAQVPAARETLCGIGVDGWKAVKRRHKYLGTFYHPIGTHYTTPQRVATITTLVFTVGVLVSFWFDVASFNTPGRVLQKLLLAFVNLLLLAPLQMLLHLMFANSRSCSAWLRGCEGGDGSCSRVFLKPRGVCLGMSVSFFRHNLSCWFRNRWSCSRN